MRKELNIITTILSIIAGMINFFFIALAIAFSSVDPEVTGVQEVTINDIMEHIYIWSSLLLATIFSWLYFYIKVLGRVFAILTALLSILGPINIMTTGISPLWLSITISLGFIIMIHPLQLMFSYNKKRG